MSILRNDLMELSAFQQCKFSFRRRDKGAVSSNNIIRDLLLEYKGDEIVIIYQSLSFSLFRKNSKLSGYHLLTYFENAEIQLLSLPPILPKQ